MIEWFRHMLMHIRLGADYCPVCAAFAKVQAEALRAAIKEGVQQAFRDAGLVHSAPTEKP